MGIGDSKRIDLSFIAAANQFLETAFFSDDDKNSEVIDTYADANTKSFLSGGEDGVIGVRRSLSDGRVYEHAIFSTAKKRAPEQGHAQTCSADYAICTPATESGFAVAGETIDKKRYMAFVAALFGFGALHDGGRGQTSQAAILRSATTEDAKLLEAAMVTFRGLAAAKKSYTITPELRGDINEFLGVTLIKESDDKGQFVDLDPFTEETAHSSTFFDTVADGCIGVVNQYYNKATNAETRREETALFHNGTVWSKACTAGEACGDPAQVTINNSKSKPLKVDQKKVMMLTAALFGFDALYDDQIKKIFAHATPADFDALDRAMATFAKYRQSAPASVVASAASSTPAEAGEAPSTAEQLRQALEANAVVFPDVRVAIPNSTPADVHPGGYLAVVSALAAEENWEKIPGLSWALQLPAFFRIAIRGLTTADRYTLGLGVDVAQEALGVCVDEHGTNVACRALNSKAGAGWFGNNRELVDWSVRLGLGSALTYGIHSAYRALTRRAILSVRQFAGQVIAQKLAPLALMCYLVDSKVLATPEKFMKLFAFNGIEPATIDQWRNIVMGSEFALSLLYIASQYRHPVANTMLNPSNPTQRIPARNLAFSVSAVVAMFYGLYYTLSENSALQEAADTKIYGKAPRTGFWDHFDFWNWHGHVFSFAFAVSFFGTWAGSAKGWAVIGPLSRMLNDPLWRAEEGVASLLGHIRRIIHAPVVAPATGGTRLAHAAAGVRQAFAQGIGHTLEAWWTTGRTAAAQYRASISTPPEGFFGRVQYHLRHGWQYGAPNPFARVLQDNPVIIDNQFTRAVREWREVRELGNAARTARRVAAAHPDIAALAESAEGVQRVFARAEFLAPEAGMVTRAVYRSLAAVSTRVVGGALGTWQILRSPRKLAFAGQFSSITAALGVLGIMIMEGGRDIPEEVVDRVSRRSFVNILPNIPTRFAFAVAGLPVYTWDFFLGNMLTTSPELNMVAQQGTYSKKKAGEYAGAIRRATDGGEKARNYCYLMQALRIADARQPAEWTALTDQEIVALEIEGVHPTRGMAILLDAAAKWKNGETLTPEEVDQFPDILVKSGVITEEQLAGVRYDSTPFAPTEYAKRLPVDIHTLIQTAHGHRAAIDARKRERGMK